MVHGDNLRQPASHYLLQLKPNVAEYGWLTMHDCEAFSSGSKVSDFWPIRSFLFCTDKLTLWAAEATDFKGGGGDRREKKGGLLALLSQQLISDLPNCGFRAWSCLPRDLPPWTVTKTENVYFIDHVLTWFISSLYPECDHWLRVLKVILMIFVLLHCSFYGSKSALDMNINCKIESQMWSKDEI